MRTGNVRRTTLRRVWRRHFILGAHWVSKYSLRHASMPVTRRTVKWTFLMLATPYLLICPASQPIRPWAAVVSTRRIATHHQPLQLDTHVSVFRVVVLRAAMGSQVTSVLHVRQAIMLPQQTPQYVHHVQLARHWPFPVEKCSEIVLLAKLVHSVELDLLFATHAHRASRATLVLPRAPRISQSL